MLDPVTQIDFPFMQRDLKDMFGDPRDGFAEYLKTVDLTMFADAFGHVRDYEGNPWGHKIYTNYVMEGPLLKAFGLIVSRGLVGQLKSYDGSFCIRAMKGGRSLSVHSWALALDLNAGTNPFKPDGRLITDFSPEFVACFYEAGFEWGGAWRCPKDAMHFQLAWTHLWQPGEGPVPFVRDNPPLYDGAIGQRQ